MACVACSVKFSLFKRKKQCTDCLRYFCAECVIKRSDRMISCDSCSMLSRRPLVRSQIKQMRLKDLRQYLLAKKVCIKGCVEKEDLVSLLMLYANGSDNRRYEQSQSSPRLGTTRDNIISDCPLGDLPIPSSETIDEHEDQNEDIHVEETEGVQVHNVEIEEITGSDFSPNSGPEPLITEQDDVLEVNTVLEEQQQDEEQERERRSETITEIPVWPGHVKLTDINELSELKYLSVKQLKNLLSTNRVDYKGCIERAELLDRACRLWEEYKQSRKDVEQMDEENLCKICWDAPIECVILECGHMACCITCGKQMSECPICKQYVVRVVRLFKA